MTDLVNVPLGSLKKGFLSTPINSVQTEGIVIDTVFGFEYDGSKQYMTILNPDGPELLSFTGQSDTGELTGVVRGLPINQSGNSSANLHGSNVQVVLSNPHTLFVDIKEAINSKLDKTGGVVTGPIIIQSDESAGITLNVFTTAERDAIADPQDGDIVYNSDLGTIEYYSNNAWIALEQSDTIFTTVGGPGNEGKAVKLDAQGKIDSSMIDNTVPEFISEPSGNDDTGKAVILNAGDKIDEAFIPLVSQEQTETMYPVFGECSNLVQNNGGIGARALPTGNLARPIPCYAYGKRVLNMIAYGNGFISGNNASSGSNTSGSKSFKLTTKGSYVAGSIPASNNIIDPNFVAIRIDLGAGESLKVKITGAICSILRNASGDGKDKSLKIVGKTVDNAPDLNNIKFTLDNIVCYSSPSGTYTTTDQTLTVEDGDFFIFSTTNSGGVRQLTNESIPALGTGAVFTSSDGVNFSEPDPNTISQVKFPNIHLLVEILGNKFGDFDDNTKQFVQVGFYETAENAKGSATNIMSLNHVGFITKVNNDGSLEVTKSNIINHADVTEVGAYYTVSGYDILKLPDTAVMFDEPRNRRIVVGRCIKPGVLQVDHRAVQFANIGRFNLPGETYPNIATISQDDKTSVFYRRYAFSEVTQIMRTGNQSIVVDAFPYPVYGRPKSIIRFGNKSSTDEYGNLADEQNAIYPLMAPKVIDRDFDTVYFSISDNGVYITPNQQTQNEDSLSNYSQSYLIEY